MILAASAGCRIGELLGLEIKDLLDDFTTVRITWIRREFHFFPSKVAENLAFVSKMFASVARFSQT
jgi:integrase